MTRSRLLGAVATILCFISLDAGSARGQGSLGWPEWLTVGNIGYCNSPGPPAYSYTAIYFFSPLSGVEATAIDGVAAMNYLISSGSKEGIWMQASMPSGVSYIRQIRFIQGKLYAAAAGRDALVSSDSGKSWTFSGLGLFDANDIYADGTGSIRSLKDPMKVFARLDTLHCIAQGTANIYVSSDGGLNWVPSNVPMVDSFSAGAFADPCKNVFVCPNSWGTVWRSTDFGEHWGNVITGSGTGSEYIDGASSTVYISDTLGLFRSTDDGSTWYSVITVDSGLHLPIFAFGPMGEHLVMPWFFWEECPTPLGGVWKLLNPLVMTSTGGMDDLHGAPSMTDSNGALLEQQDTMNVPLELASACQPFLVPVTVESDVDSMSVRITLRDSLNDFALAASDSTIALRKGHEDTVWMQYDPHHSVSNVVINFENHWHCSDWSETRTVHVDALPAAAISSPPVFAASCIPDTEAAMVRFDSCDVLCIDSVGFPASIVANLHVATKLPDTNGVGYGDSLLLAFNSAGMTGTMRDSIVIYGHYLRMDSLLNDYFYFPHASGIDTDFSFFYTTVPVTLHALGTGTVLSSKDSSLNTGARNLCDVRDTFAVIKNPGCDTACIDTAILSGVGFAIERGEGAACLAPGGSDTIWIAIQADTIGHPLANAARITVTSDANPPLPPIVLSRGIEYPLPWALLLSSPAEATTGTRVTYKLIQSGSLPPSVTSLDFTVTYNGDLLGLQGNADSHVTFSTTPDGLAHLHFHFAPVPSDSVLDSIILTAFVARDTETELSLEDIVLGNSQNISSDCLASVTTAQSSFTLLPECGTPALTEVLRTGTISIDRIEPNPARSAVTITLYSGENNSAPGELSLVDAMGRMVTLQTLILQRGANRVPVNLASLPSGFYTARIITAQGTAQRSFVKE